LFSIPLVVIIVLICSLFESFYILPHHLYKALSKPFKKEPAWREQFENKFLHFKYHYRRLLAYTLEHRAMTFSITFSGLVLAFGLVIAGRVPFTFFPSPEANTLTAYVQFASGTPAVRVQHFLTEMETALYQAEQSFDESLIQDAVVYQNLAFSENTARSERGSEFGTIFVELTAPDLRDIRNPEFIERWKSFIPKESYIESLNIESPKSGPPGLDIDIQLGGANTESLKAAALELRAAIERFVGVYNAEDDVPFGRTQWILELTPQGHALGLTAQDIATQVRSAFEGYSVQSFYDNEDKIDVKVLLPDNERFSFSRFDSLPIITPSGIAVPLSNVTTVKSKVGMQALRHTDTRLAVHVTASVDYEQTNANRVLASLAKDVMPEIAQKHGVTWSFAGTSADETHTLGEMKTGAIVGFAMIYLILCWILSSYLWPFIVMLAIPFGLAGAIYGHFLLGLDLTLLSLFGLFGLAGIVINDSIIMIMTYIRHREAGLIVHDALLQAGSDRLRAVLLTSLTTIGGLAPLLFETSLQAQFLIPMAASIVFGLTLSTALVLIVIPGLIQYFEEIKKSTG
jgi:multidrug efflux pump subunit AcrB